MPDTEYADLTLAMRAGDDPGAVFDALLARGQIRLHPDAAALREALAAAAAEHHRRGEHVAVVVDTREQAAELNAAIRDRLVADGRVDDRARGRHRGRAADRRRGPDRHPPQRPRPGRGQPRHLDRHRRRPGGGLRRHPRRHLPAGDVPGGVTPDPATGARVLPADYVTAHVELAYASTAHGVQGDTVTAAHLVIGEHTGAASAYVGMTRGRAANTAHLVAADLDEAREQWIAVFARDRADLGPAHAARARRRRGRPLRPAPPAGAGARRAARGVDGRAALPSAARLLSRSATRCARSSRSKPRTPANSRNLEAARDQTAIDARTGRDGGPRTAARPSPPTRTGSATPCSRAGTASATPPAQAARVVLDGPGRLGLRRGAVARAGEQLTDWADRWRPHVPSLPTDPKELARVAGWFDDRPALWEAFDASARRPAEHAHPEHAQLCARRRRRPERARAGPARLAEAGRRRDERLDPFGPVAWTPDPAGRLADLQRDIAATRQELTDTRARIATLTAEPALLAPAAPTGSPANARPGAHGARRARPARIGDARGRPPRSRPSHGPRPSASGRPSPGVAPPQASADEWAASAGADRGPEQPTRENNWRFSAGSGGRLSARAPNWRLLR